MRGFVASAVGGFGVGSSSLSVVGNGAEVVFGTFGEEEVGSLLLFFSVPVTPAIAGGATNNKATKHNNATARWWGIIMALSVACKRCAAASCFDMLARAARGAAAY